MLPRGAAIGMISSAAGLGWQNNLRASCTEFLDITDFDEAVALDEDQPEGRLHVEQAGDQRLRRARSAVDLLEARHPHQRDPARPDRHAARAGERRHVARVSATDYRAETGIEPSTPMEQAYPLVFLCSDAASYVNGITVITDAGLLQLGDHRVVPRRDTRRRLLEQRVLTTPAILALLLDPEHMFV